MPMVDPSKLFYHKESNLATHAIYYTEDIIYDIGPSQIGGIEGLSIEKKEAVREICSIKLKFGNDSPVHRVFVNPAKAVKVCKYTSQGRNR
jgi:hypothetical protein